MYDRQLKYQNHGIFQQLQPVCIYFISNFIPLYFHSMAGLNLPHLSCRPFLCLQLSTDTQPCTPVQVCNGPAAMVWCNATQRERQDRFFLPVFKTNFIPCCTEKNIPAAEKIIEALLPAPASCFTPSRLTGDNPGMYRRYKRYLVLC